MKKYFSSILIAGGIWGSFLLISIILTGCTGIKVTSVWVDPEYQGNGIENVFVVGISKDGGLRRIFEDEFVTLFRQEGIKATASYRVLLDEELRHEKKLDNMVKASGSDTILMTRLIDVRKETQYIPPDYIYGLPPHFADGWHTYYNRAYLVSPGYMVAYDTAVLETNVYDLKTDTLIWSARADIPADDGMAKHIKNFVRAIMKQLADAGLIPND